MGKTFSDIYAVSNTATIANSDLMILQRSDGNTYAFTATSLISYEANNGYYQTTSGYSDANSNITLDLTKQIHKLLPSSVNTYSYVLGNGSEGQIIHLVPGHSNTNPFINENTGVKIQNARWSSNLQITEGSISYWLPFTDAIFNQSSGSCVVTLIFTDGCWNLPHK